MTDEARGCILAYHEYPNPHRSGWRVHHPDCEGPSTLLATAENIARRVDRFHLDIVVCCIFREERVPRDVQESLLRQYEVSTWRYKDGGGNMRPADRGRLLVDLVQRAMEWRETRWRAIPLDGRGM